MFAFLFLAIPAFLVFYCITDNQFENKKSFIPPVLFGFLTGIFYVAIKEFFIFSTELNTANFFKTAAKFFLHKEFIPLAVCAVIFLIFSKDNAQYKISALTPLFYSFYLVFVPYEVISRGEKTSFFCIVLLPFFAISAVLIFTEFLNLSFKYFKIKKNVPAVLFIVAALVSSFVPAIEYALWYFKISTFLLVFIAILFFVASFFSIIFFRKENFKKEEEYRPVFMDM